MRGKFWTQVLAQGTAAIVATGAAAGDDPLILAVNGAPLDVAHFGFVQSTSIPTAFGRHAGAFRLFAQKESRLTARAATGPASSPEGPVPG